MVTRPETEKFFLVSGPQARLQRGNPLPMPAVVSGEGPQAERVCGASRGRLLLYSAAVLAALLFEFFL
jgi:hypothetical protein